MHEKRFSHKLSARKRGLLSVWSSLIIIISEENRFRSSTWAGTNFTLWKSRSNKTLEGLLLTSCFPMTLTTFANIFFRYWGFALIDSRWLWKLPSHVKEICSIYWEKIWNLHETFQFDTNDGKFDTRTMERMIKALCGFFFLFFRLCRMWINFGKFLLINHG